MPLHVLQSLPFWVAAVQWFIIPLVLWLAVQRRVRRIQSGAAMLLEAIVLTTTMSALFAAPLWLFELLPLRGERWTAYTLGCFAGGAISVVARKAFKLRD